MGDIKTGDEVLEEYFKGLSENEQIDKDLRENLLTLWKEKKIESKTTLIKMLDELRREQKS